ncbi:MAG: DUF4446 family protein [Chloroflexota bacterium]|nr:DUF4446 family protein [Chloroflexota bacterium]
MEIFVLILFVLLMVLGGWLAFVEFRYQNLARSFRLLMTGRGGADLEATLIDFVQRMDRVEQMTQSMGQRVDSIQVQQPYHVQHVGVVRFNPFQDKGGDQSFVVAILDAHADGAVITSLSSRSDTRIYAKPVIGGQSTYTLTNEEKDAIARAMKPRA